MCNVQRYASYEHLQAQTHLCKLHTCLQQLLEQRLTAAAFGELALDGLPQLLEAVRAQVGVRGVV